MTQHSLAGPVTARRPTRLWIAIVVVITFIVVGQVISWFSLAALGMDRESVSGQIASNVVGFLPALLLLFLWVARKEQRPLTSVGLSGAGRFRTALLGVLTAVAALAAALLMISSVAGIAIGNDETRAAISGNPAPWLIGLLLTFTLQASTEEVLFRGYLLPIACGARGTRLGVVITSAVFSLAHLITPEPNLFQLVSAFLLGAALALWALADQSLWRSAAFHSAWNCGLVLFWPSETGAEEARATQSLGSAAAVLSVLFLLVVVALVTYRRSTPNHPDGY